jgi:hypothetical protein
VGRSSARALGALASAGSSTSGASGDRPTRER